MGSAAKSTWDGPPGQQRDIALKARRPFFTNSLCISHLGGSPGLQIGVFGIGKPFDDPRTSAVWTPSPWIGCRFRRLIVEIICRQANSAAPIWIGPPYRRELSRNWPKIEAAVYQPAEIG